MGISHYVNLKTNQKQIEKLIQLVNWIKTEIRYTQAEIYDIVKDLLNNNNFKSLSFLNDVKNNMNNMSFPKAWETAIASWNSSMLKEDEELLNSMANILGASDSTGQISALDHIEKRFEASYEAAKNLCETKGKLYKSLGILMGLAVCVIFI